MIEINLSLKTSLILALLAYAINVSTSYQQFLIEDDRLCTPTSIRKVALEAGNLSGLIVSLRNMTTLKENAHKWGDQDFVCKFQVKATEKDSGIFAVIQNIVFRKDKITNECLDYIQYSAVNSTFKSKRYCGQMDADTSLMSMPVSNSFVEPTIVLDVHINISKEPLRPYRILELQIVFTSFRFCFQKLFFDDQQCSPNHTVHCIHKGFINDGYINCPYPGCVDEKECVQKIQSKTKRSALSYEAIVFIALLTTVLFMLGVWLGYKIKKLHNENATISLDNNVVSECIEMDPVPEGIDNPPSYESLFPSRPPVSYS
ncbi:hypothetical protein ILUMI_04277 [Ignelater luminosus]|uniref:Uncharacterized protein n=1 Tax=Ignelater luminosus TaxID=2038154 RepID=A0A8K0DE64_IGNLU|nr:hypothetical protein ILUMI_04277 [Ignelater luminosus]